MIVLGAMVYALTITIVVGLALLAFIGVGVVLAQRAAGGTLAWPSLRSWRWYPSPLGLLLLFALVGLLFWRVLPVFLLVPILLPFFWRRRRMRGPFFFTWKPGRRPAPPRAGFNGHDRPIEDQYRPLDDE